MSVETTVKRLALAGVVCTLFIQCSSESNPQEASKKDAGVQDGNVGADAGTDGAAVQDGASTQDAAAQDSGSGGAGGTLRYLQPPKQNATSVDSIAALDAVLASLQSDWSGTMAGWGLPSSGVSPVITLVAGQYGDLALSNRGPYPETVIIRGEGPFTSDGYAPAAGTKVERIRLKGCQNLEFWLMQFEPLTIGTDDSLPYKGADQHRVESSKHVRFMRCAILGDVARSTAALDVAPKSGVYTLVNQGGGTTFGNANESDDIEWRQCVFMGSSKAVFGHRAGRSDDIRIDGCVSAQNFGDFIQFVGEGQTDNWTIKDTYAMAKGRASAADHRDFIQFEKVLTPHSHANWSIEGNWIQSRDAWGDDRYLAKQGLWGNANLGAMKDTAVDNLFAIPGKAMQGHWKDVTFEFNTIIPPIDSLGADSNDQNGVRPNTWDPAFIVPANDDATLAADENIIVSHANGFDNGFAGPNGLVIWQNGFWQFSHANKGPPDWSLLGKYLENYAGAPTKPVSVDYTNSGTAANNGKYQLSPRESSDAVGVPDVGVEQFKPKAGTRMHWADPDPTGCYKLFERVFDTTNHDNPTDWGWPTAVAFHIYYDPNNAAGGASGNYDSFDANGD